MSDIFIKVLNMSISAGWVVLAVLLLRLVLKRAPKWVNGLLWAVVAFRLICPLSAQSVLSLLPSAETVSPQIMTVPNPTVYTGVEILNSSINPVFSEAFSPAPGASANPLQIWIPVASVVWLLGIGAMLIYTAISYWGIRRKVSSAVRLQDNIYETDAVASPFVLGIFRPKIYVPFGMPEGAGTYVLAHEQAHIRRKDHLWKPLGFLLLSLHWFNPLIWLGYILLCRDIELACDEKVVGKLEGKHRADYSQALLSCSVHRKSIAACPLAFGEVGVKKRVKSVLNYKKPAFWVVLLSVLTLTVTALCFLTDPMGLTLEEVDKTQLSHYRENTIRIYAGKEEVYGEAFAIEQRVIDRLFDLTLSTKGVSREDTKGVYSIVLQTTADVQKHLSSGLSGMHIWFNRDFTQVWAQKGDWQSIVYRVQRPAEMESLYGVFSGTAHYRIVGNVVTGSDMWQLKERYPQYFDLPTDKGLELYIWQMSGDSYTCILLPGKNLGYTQTELLACHNAGTTLEVMRAIVSSYMPELSRENVTIVPVTMPHSSYAYNIDDAYIENLNKLFWDGFPVYTPQCIDSAVFDVDADGVEETCLLTPGPTSGLFTFCIEVRENGVTEYYNIFLADFYYLSFVRQDGELKLKGVTQGGNPETYYFQIDTVGENLSLTAGNKTLGYWGTQGPLSPFVAGHRGINIVDTTETENISCDQAFEEIYRDKEFIYYLPCIKSQYVLVYYTYGDKEDIKTALNNNRVGIEDLDTFDITYIKSPIDP